LILSLLFTGTKAGMGQSTSKKLLPLFELGSGLIFTHFPDYPGSGHSRQYVLPFPVAIYRGRLLRSDQEGGVRGRLLQTQYVESDMTYGGTVSAPGKQSPDRSGMPVLKNVGEAGPALVLKLYRSRDPRLDVVSSFRLAFSTNFRMINYQGNVYSTFLRLRFNDILPAGGTTHLRLGMKYASQMLMRLYYEVSKPYITAERPAFTAKPGLMYWNASFHSYLPVSNNFSLFSSLITFFTGQSANRQSPLLTVDRNHVINFGFLYTFYRSREKGWR